VLKYLISQNCDGLHRKSGILPQNLSELHGNTNLETCIKCKKEYLRDFDASADYHTDVHDHRTGRKCSVIGCGGELHDSIINFGENLPKIPLQKAVEQSEKADLHLVLGSSLTVSPANSMPKRTNKSGGSLVIVNLQKTPLDDKASLRIFAKCDDVMKLVMKKLGYQIPTFKIRRYLVIEMATKSSKSSIIRVAGIDSDGTPASYIKRLEYSLGGKLQKLKEEPFQIEVAPNTSKLDLKIHFMGHYLEPPLDIHHQIGLTDSKSNFVLEYSPLIGQWTVTEDKGNTDNISSSMKDMVIEERKETGKKTLVVGNSHKSLDTLDSNSHEWTIYVTDESGKDCSTYIEEVAFRLHPTFSPSVVTLTQAPFAVTRIGWGTFKIGVIVTFKNGKQMEFKHSLTFEKGGSETNYTIEM